QQVPGDGFAFAVGVGGQIKGFRLRRRLGDGIDMLGVPVDDLVFHGEAVLRIDSAFLGDQVAHMTIRGEDLEVLAEVSVDGARLSGKRRRLATELRSKKGVLQPPTRLNSERDGASRDASEWNAASRRTSDLPSKPAPLPRQAGRATP